MPLKANFVMTPFDAPRDEPIEDEMFSTMVNKNLIKFDRELYRTKWFDYRLMSPFRATMAYVEAYEKVYRIIYARAIDTRVADFVKPPSVTWLCLGLRNGQPKFRRLLSGFWRGRQVADALGMPYELYIEYAFEARMRNWQQRYLPRECHLYGEWDVERVQAQWEEMQSARLFMPEHPAYMIENYAGIFYQDDYHEWLFKQAGLRSDRPYFLARFVKEGRLSVDKVRARLNERELESFESFLQQSDCI